MNCGLLLKTSGGQPGRFPSLSGSRKDCWYKTLLEILGPVWCAYSALENFQELQSHTGYCIVLRISKIRFQPERRRN